MIEIKIEPLIHGIAEDVLPAKHPLANETFYCDECNAMLHASNNECMLNWAETGKGNFCLPCFVDRLKHDSYEEAYGLNYYNKMDLNNTQIEINDSVYDHYATAVIQALLTKVSRSTYLSGEEVDEFAKTCFAITDVLLKYRITKQ